MKVIISFSIVLLFLSCAETKKQYSEFFYLYYKYSTEENYEKNGESHVEYFNGKFIKLIGDSIIINSYFFDLKFKSKSCFSFKYITHGKNLYRVNSSGEKKLFLTTENNYNVFYQIVYKEFGNKQASENEEEEILGGSNYRFISEIKYKNETTEDSMVLYKFFVRFSRIESTDTTYFGETDYYYYYDKDFILYKKEYLGPLLYEVNTERVNYLWKTPHGLFNEKVSDGSFIFE
jgi:hypothetical protein